MKKTGGGGGLVVVSGSDDRRVQRCEPRAAAATHPVRGVRRRQVVHVNFAVGGGGHDPRVLDVHRPHALRQRQLQRGRARRRAHVPRADGAVPARRDQRGDLQSWVRARRWTLRNRARSRARKPHPPVCPTPPSPPSPTPRAEWAPRARRPSSPPPGWPAASCAQRGRRPRKKWPSRRRATPNPAAARRPRCAAPACPPRTRRRPARPWPPPTRAPATAKAKRERKRKKMLST